MTVEKPKPGKQLLPPVTTGAGSAINQSQFLAIICNSLKAQKESRIHGAIGFRLASHWFKNWHESLKPITRRSNCNHVITFDSHVQNALKVARSVSMHTLPLTGQVTDKTTVKWPFQLLLFLTCFVEVAEGRHLMSQGNSYCSFVSIGTIQYLSV